MSDKCLVCGGEVFETSQTTDGTERKHCIHCGYALGTTAKEELMESLEDDLDSSDFH